jgi:hypothetical protein
VALGGTAGERLCAGVENASACEREAFGESLGIVATVSEKKKRKRSGYAFDGVD